MKRSVVLIGMMGAGKSAVGAELSRRLAVPLLDTDAEIVRAAAMSIPQNRPVVLCLREHDARPP